MGGWRGCRYVALGSSFAAGAGLRPMATDRARAAHQSQANYAHLAAARLGMVLRDVTSSGATTLDLLRTEQHGQPPQLTAVVAGTDLATVTIGGNDVSYVQTLFALSAPSWLRRLPGVRGRLAALVDPDAVAARFDALTANLTDVVKRITDQGVRQVVLVDYLTVLPDTWTDDLPLTEPGWAVCHEIAARLVATTAQVAESTGAALLGVAEASRDHHAWSAQPWTSGFTLPFRSAVGYHPTAAGMRAVADLLCGHLLSTG